MTLQEYERRREEMSRREEQQGREMREKMRQARIEDEAQLRRRQREAEYIEDDLDF